MSFPEGFIPDDEPLEFVADNHKRPRLHEQAPSTAFFFPGKQAEYRRNQIEEFNAKADLQIAQENFASKLELNARTTDNEIATLPTRLKERNEQLEQAHKLSMRSQEVQEQQHQLLETQAKATGELTGIALARHLDLATLPLVRLEEEKVKTEVDKSRQLKEIEREHHEDLKEIDFEYLEKETNLKLVKAIEYSVREKQVVILLQDNILAQLDRLYQLKAGADPEELKQAKLEVLTDVTNGFKGQLRGLLQAPERENIRGSDTDTEPRPDNRQVGTGDNQQTPAEDIGDESY